MIAKYPRLAWGLQVFAVLLPVWLVLDGANSLWVGVVASALGAWLAARLVPVAPHGWHPLRFFAFAGYFLWESLRGAADVAWRALHPRLPIEPRVVPYEISLPAGKPRTLLVSVVSLLPGTLSADLSADGRVLQVHALTPDAEDSVDALERRIARLFGLPSEDGA